MIFENVLFQDEQRKRALQDDGDDDDTDIDGVPMDDNDDVQVSQILSPNFFICEHLNVLN